MSDETNGEWVKRANCRDEDPELFFPENENSEASRIQIKVAKEV